MDLGPLLDFVLSGWGACFGEYVSLSGGSPPFYSLVSTTDINGGFSVPKTGTGTYALSIPGSSMTIQGYDDSIGTNPVGDPITGPIVIGMTCQLPDNGFLTDITGPLGIRAWIPSTLVFLDTPTPNFTSSCAGGGVGVGAGGAVTVSR